MSNKMMDQGSTVSSETEIAVSAIAVDNNVVEPISAVVRPALEVIAPTNMEGGYRFHVNTGAGRTLQVEVPQGGVQAGQRFAAWVVDDMEGLQQLEQPNNNAALGWRDGFFHCLKFGICHPMCCLAFWCAPCVLGQVMTRSNLTILGNPKTSASSPNDAKPFWTPFKIMFALTALYIAIRGITSTVIDYTVDSEDSENNNGNEDDDDVDYPAWAEAIIFVRFVIFVAFSIFTLVLIIKTRRFLRHKDHIPAENCGKMEDCCMSFWCPWCTVCHMARHTADYNQVDARCCSDTGLPANAPMYV